MHRLTRRDAAAFPDDCPQPPPAGWPGCQVQNLHYTYDPAGNITHIRDDAQQTIYFRNQRVEPSTDYTYDALYRLIEATGREHIGPSRRPTGRLPWRDEFRADRPHPGDGQAMRPYIEQYVYDAVGNFLPMMHHASNGNWTRAYCLPRSQPDRTRQDQQSPQHDADRQQDRCEPYTYDAHGNMTTHAAPAR